MGTPKHGPLNALRRHFALIGIVFVTSVAAWVLVDALRTSRDMERDNEAIDREIRQIEADAARLERSLP